MAFNRRTTGKSLFGSAWNGITPGATSSSGKRPLARTVQGSTTKPKKNSGWGEGNQLGVGRDIRRPSGSRGSSFYASGRTAPKDTRNLTDKAVQNQLKIRLVQALTELEYPQFSEKMLKQPTKIDFVRIFEHIFRTIAGPGYKCSGKIEEEIPRLFRDMGYPFPIKASTMMTISAAHSWPHVLGALVWLVDLIKFGEHLDVKQMLYGSEDDFSDNSNCTKTVIHGYYKSCFNLKLCQDGDEEVDYNGLDKFLEEVLMNGPTEKGEAGMDQLERNKASLQEELDQLKKAPNREETLEDEIKRVNLDFTKMTEYLNSLTAFRAELKQQIEISTERRHGLEKERDEIQIRLREKENVVASQKISAKEVRQMRFKKDEADRVLKALTDEVKEKSQEQWSLETVLSHQGQDIQTKFRNVTQGFKILLSKIQPEGFDWENMVNLSISPLSPKFAAYCNDTLKKQGRQLLTYCNKNVHKAKAEILELNNTVDEHNEWLLTNREEIDDLVSKAALIDKEMEEYKSIRAAETQKVKQELGRKRDQVAGQGQMRNMSFEEKQKEAERLEHELKTQKRKLDAELSKKIGEIIRCTNLIAEHKGRITKMHDEAAAKLSKLYTIPPDPEA